MQANEHEHERFISRLSTLRGFSIQPSVGRWVLIRVEDHEQFAERLSQKLEPGAISIPEHLPGTIRLPVRDAKANEQVVLAMAELLGELDSEAEDEDLEISAGHSSKG